MKQEVKSTLTMVLLSFCRFLYTVQQMLLENINNKGKFEKNDWDHLHDCILYVSGKKSTQEELVKVFSTLPDELQNDAYEYGMSDTLWRDKFIEWYQNLL